MADKQNENPFDGEYVGNIWGWKISFWGLGVILFFVGLMKYRSYSTGQPFFPDKPPVEQVAPIDSTEVE